MIAFLNLDWVRRFLSKTTQLGILTLYKVKMSVRTFVLFPCFSLCLLVHPGVYAQEHASKHLLLYG
jgi:hypothetical protein